MGKQWYQRRVRGAATNPHTRGHTRTHTHGPGMEWSYPSDMFSVGCIVVELMTGEALFQTHHNREHLAMMEKVLGHVPRHMIAAANQRSQSYFDHSGAIIFPEPGVHESTKYVDAMVPLSSTIDPHVFGDMYDLVVRLLDYDPNKRLTATQALNHPFFRHHP
eukprot:TRINITY_DN1521_c0_g6_i1.p1 TRINITY_DN1521_c0_g6~~TRINITY_DN1521_c0_g6_i1.p1  ORF type:complete len:162 (-),score=47.48 TRINITY_DN1521_c0_g6_i1:63-548(-)